MLVAAAPSGLAQSAELPEPVPAVVLVTAVPQEAGASSALERVLVRAMSLEMVRGGFEALPWLPPEEEARSETELLGVALRRGADFLLLGRYTLGDRQTTIRFRFHDLATNRLLAVEEAAGPIDLALDDLVASALAPMVSAVAPRAAIVSERKTLEAARQAEQRRLAAAQAEAAAREQRRDQEPAPQPLPAEGPVAPARAERERHQRIELALGFAPFVPVGAPTEYFQLGYLPVVGCSYRLAAAFGVFGLGAHTGVMYLDPRDPPSAAYLRWLVPVGIDVRYSLPESRPFALYAQLSGGGAYRLPDSFSEESAVSERLTRWLPYARAGIGMAVGVSERFGLTVETLYHAYFYVYREGDGSGSLAVEVLSGLLPSVGLYVRW